MAPLEQGSVQYQPHISLVTEEGERRGTALTHSQLFQHGILVSKSEISASNAQFFTKFVQIDLPVVQDGHQPEPFLLFVFKKQVFTVSSFHVLDVGHHFLHSEHLEISSSAVSDSISH